MSEHPSLFNPFALRGCMLPNRIVMAPMTRCFAPAGVPGADIAAYYRRRAEGGVGLIISEATHVPHAGAANDPACPDFHGEAALAGWQRIASEVHAAGGRIVPQLWHVGLLLKAKLENLFDAPSVLGPGHVGPSGYAGGMEQPVILAHHAMSEAEIHAVIAAFGQAAADARRLGFDGIEIHGAHGYLIDQFFWEVTNRREDDWGGSLERRTRFGAAVVAECRRRTAPDFPILMRISQWKGQDYTAKLAQDPAELERFLRPLVDAGVDLFDCSQRRVLTPEFPGSELNLAGWVKHITGLPVMTVGSVGLERELIETLYGTTSKPARLDGVVAMLERGEIDLVGVGRALLADADWARKVRRGAWEELQPFSAASMATLS